jgi:hypothetical protein
VTAVSRAGSALSAARAAAATSSADPRARDSRKQGNCRIVQILHWGRFYDTRGQGYLIVTSIVLEPTEMRCVPGCESRTGKDTGCTLSPRAQAHWVPAGWPSTKSVMRLP